MADLGVTPFQEPPICFSISGWWFRFLLFFHYIGNTHPNWLSYFSDWLKSTDMFGLRYVQACEVKKEALDDWSFRSPSHINDKSIHLHIHISYIYIYYIYIYIAIYTYYIFLYIYIFKINIEFSHRFSISASIHRRLPGFDQSLDKVKLPSGPSAEGKCPMSSDFNGKSMGNLWEKSKINGKIMENWVNIGVILWWRNALCYVCFAEILDGESSSKSACDGSSHWGTGFCMRQAELVSFPAVTFVHLLATILSIHLLNQRPFVWW